MSTSYEPPPDERLYYERVWAIARRIPRGKVATYGQIAGALPRPDGVSPEVHRISASRWVGSAMAACPDDVPWQRVINSQGKISRRSDAGRQRQLLEREGVSFAKGKVDLNEFQWRGPGQGEEPRQERLF